MCSLHKTCAFCGKRNYLVTRHCRRCRAPFGQTFRPDISVVMRLGSRSTLLPPYLVIANNTPTTVSITRLQIGDDYQFDLDGPTANTVLPLVLEPGQRSSVAASQFRRLDTDEILQPAGVHVKVAYWMEADGEPVSNTTLAWLGTAES